MVGSNNPKVSVIIPVYNVEKYLRQCLDSVVNQTFTDIEIICVDDGSTDSSLEILKEYETNDSRITVLRQQNKFAGVARNYGMSIAKGEYYVFLDSDDFFEPTLIEKQYNQCSKYDADIGICGAYTYNNSTGESAPAPWILNTNYISEQPFNRFSLKENTFFVSTPCPWNKMFSAKFIKAHALEYLPLPRSNDHYFVFSAISLADKIVAMNEPLVYYRIGMNTNLQANIHKTPLTICESLAAIKCKLDEEGIFEQVAVSFEKHVIDQMLYTLWALEGHYDFQVEFVDCMRGLCLEKFELFDRIGTVSPQNICDMVDKLYGIDKEFAGLALVKYLDQNTESVSLVKKIIGLKVYRELVNKQRVEKRTVKPGNKMPDHPRISVIIPVYNASEYILECLDSITRQCFRDIEIICVDDGSLDNSLEMLFEYQNTHGFISIISQANSGQSVARNTGLEFAKGEYILFVDSDDCLLEGALETLYSCALANNLDLLYFGADCLYENEELEADFSKWTSYYHVVNNYDTPRAGDKLFFDLQANDEFRVSPCMQLIKRSLLSDNDIRFIPEIIHEDNFFSFQVVMSAASAARIDRNLYLRRVRNDSIMTSGVTFDDVYGYLRCYIALMDYVLELEIQNYEIAEKVQSFIDDIGRAAIGAFKSIVDDKEQRKLSYLSLYERNYFELLNYRYGESYAVEAVRSSISFRVGALITYIPRKMFYVYRYIRQHGLKKTIGYIQNKLTSR